MRSVEAGWLKEALRFITDSSGVYLFKNSSNDVCYVGKAKNLKNRVRSYAQNVDRDWKANTILSATTQIETIETKNELEAMLLEARLIQSYQPRFNVLLKTGQPYTYFLITDEPLPRLKIVRKKGEKGEYFGPFIEQTAANRVFKYLLEQFRLDLCNKKIANGCLAYHMKRCPGVCKDDFDATGYKERLELVRTGLKKEKDRFFADIGEQIKAATSELNFEYARQLTNYRDAFERVFEALAVKFDRPQSLQKLADKDVWVLITREQIKEELDGDSPFDYLFLYREKQGVLTKSRLFCLIREQEAGVNPLVHEYMQQYYTLYRPSRLLLTDFMIEDRSLLRDFIAAWHKLDESVAISTPEQTDRVSTHAELCLLARQFAVVELKKTYSLGAQLKKLLKLPSAPRTIDCFDISHKQGHSQVGSCIRFKDGQPEPSSFRHFNIKLVDQQDDYASLQEVVQRRYKDPANLPDLIVIDGGKGQLNSVDQVIGDLVEAHGVGLVSLAKREETVFAKHLPEGKVLNQKSLTGQVLIALRDYTHHFAISFHRKKFEKAFISKRSD